MLHRASETRIKFQKRLNDIKNTRVGVFKFILIVNLFTVSVKFFKKILFCRFFSDESGVIMVLLTENIKNHSHLVIGTSSFVALIVARGQREAFSSREHHFTL